VALGWEPQQPAARHNRYDEVRRTKNQRHWTRHGDPASGYIEGGLELGIGDVAVGLALKRADRRINVGWLVFAALLPDFLLGWFVLAGWESYSATFSLATTYCSRFRGRTAWRQIWRGRGLPAG